jgi:hypothetical protein
MQKLPTGRVSYDGAVVLKSILYILLQLEGLRCRCGGTEKTRFRRDLD